MLARSRIALWLPLVVWLASWATCHVFVSTYASRIPYFDDLEIVPAITPGMSVKSAFEWWWAPANEHRVILPRLVFVGLLETFHDFRASMHFQVVVQALLAWALVVAARRLRGAPSVADACFPLLLLNWGNAENFLLGMQITIAVPTALVCGFLILGLRQRGLPSARTASWMCACLFLLPLNGGFGLTQVPPLLVWCAVAAWAAWRSRDRRQRAAGMVFTAGTLATIGLTSVYFIGLHPAQNHPLHWDAIKVLRTAAGFVTLGLGPIVRDYGITAFVATLAFVGPAAWYAARAWRTADERWRASLALAVMSCTSLIALGIGIGRSHDGPDAGTAFRYVTLPTPLLVAACFAFVVFAQERVASAAAGGLCLVLFAVQPFNVSFGRTLGEARRANSAAFEAAIAAKWPSYALASRFWPSFYNFRSRFELLVEGLIAARWPPFDVVPADEPWPSAPSTWMWTTPPSTPPAGEQSTMRLIDEEPTPMLNAACELTFDVPPTAHRVHALFGLPTFQSTKSPEPVQMPKGLRVRLSWRTPEGAERTLYERSLRPREVATDRGIQELDMAFPPGTAGVLVLRTRLADGTPSNDGWSFWRDFAIE